MRKRFFFAGILCILFARLSWGQVILDASKVKETVVPGQTISGTLTLRNSSDTDISIRAYMEDFIYVSPFDASKEFLPAGATDNSASSWIRYSPQEFVLPAFGTRRVNYTIEVPSSARGGYYGVLFFENTEPPTVGGLQIITRMGCLFFLETTDSIKLAAVDEVSASSQKLHAQFSNKGNRIIIASPIYYTMDAEGMVVDRGKIATLYLPPGESAQITIPVNLSRGAYTTVTTFDIEDGDALVNEIDFSIDASGSVRVGEIRQ